MTSFPGAVLTVAVALLAPSPAVATEHPAALLAIVEELRALRVPDEIDGVPDYSAAAVDRQKRALRTLAQRFDRLAPEGWTRHDRVDYLLLRSELDRLEKQIEQMLAETIVKGDNSVNWREFHDAMLQYGQIPLALVRWELTGNSDQVEEFWKDPDRPSTE